MDSYLSNRTNKVDVIKMNVQGAEALCVKGAIKTINQYLPLIITEFWPYGIRNVGSDPIEFVCYLISIGYTGYELDVLHLGVEQKEKSELVDLVIESNENDVYYLIFQHSSSKKYFYDLDPAVNQPYIL